ncbi:MAG TPA: hypothetical protein VFG08_02575, partial [Candidatus Polarisedimenticolia bacterium]|nr:hypothetical protein [Candidatus Polarisedimenticolia bacterium]
MAMNVRLPVRDVAAGLALAILFITSALAQQAGAPPAAAPASADLRAARDLFEANLDAIRRRDRDAYLATYLDSEQLARTGPEGPSLGFASHAQQAGDDS